MTENTMKFKKPEYKQCWDHEKGEVKRHYSKPTPLSKAVGGIAGHLEIPKAEIMVLSFDQSPRATGIVLGPYHHTGGSTVRMAYTAKSEQEIIDYLTALHDVYADIDLICREEGFIVRDARHVQGLGIKDMGGFVRGVCRILWPAAFHVEIHPSTWRSKVHNHTKGTAEYWKEVSLRWAQTDCSIIQDHHQADARGIMAAGGQMWFNGELKNKT